MRQSKGEEESRTEELQESMAGSERERERRKEELRAVTEFRRQRERRRRRLGGFVKNVKCNVTKGRAWKMRTGEAFIYAYREGNGARTRGE